MLDTQANTAARGLPTEVGGRLRAAWDDRWSSQIESVIRKFPELRIELGLPLAGSTAPEAERAWIYKDRSTQQAILESDALLLSSSLYRVKGLWTESRELLEQAGRVLQTAGLSGSFRLHFERGIGSYLQGHFLTAIEDFFSASRLAGEPLFRLLALTNALFCLENLGVDSVTTQGEIEALRKKIQGDLPVFRANEGGLRAFRMRQAFRRGEVKSALDESAEDASGATLDQSNYYALWIRQLPYHAQYRRLSRAKVEALLASPHALFQRGYRIRTLLGHTHADDAGFVRLSDRVDRLYLWTWMWLVDPQHLTSDRLLTAVHEVLANVEISKLTLEDQFLLRNALGWLGLVDPSFQDKVRVVLTKIQSVSSAGYTLFEMEWATIQFLRAQREGRAVVVRDTESYLKRHPHWKSEEMLFAHLSGKRATSTQTAKSPEGIAILRALSQRIRAEKQATRLKRGQTIAVDMNTFIVTERESGRKMVSQPLAVSLKLLRERASISCADLAREAFGLYQYDSFVHASKIFNLISRLRTLVQGRLRIRVKSGNVLAEGDWDFVQITEAAALSTQLRGELISLQLTSPRMVPEIARKNVVVARLYKSFHGRPGFTRSEAQDALQTSKSTVNRVLEKMMAQGKLEVLGVGRSSRYRFKNAEGKVTS